MAEADQPGEGKSLFKDIEVIEYQAVSGLALAGCLLGLLAAGAVIWPLFWVVPPLGLLVSLIAVVRISRQPSVLTGMRFALVGLALSVFFTALVPAYKIAYDWSIRRQAQQFASIWFDCLRDGKAVEAYQLSLDPRYRRPLGEVYAQVSVADSDARESLREFVQSPDVRTLLALGEDALVRYYETESQATEGDREVVVAVYAVTFEDEGRKKSFFIRLWLERHKLPVGNESDWYVASNRGGYRPISLGGQPD